MKQLGMLKPGRYPSLRFSLFCGEPLPVSSASAWLEAAPNSILENLYGPTELTIACTLYRWDPVTLRRLNPSSDIVPIGYPYPGMGVLVADENLKEVGLRRRGRIADERSADVPRVLEGPCKNSSSLCRSPGQRQTSITGRETGCAVLLENGPLTHLGRIDFQVKILGHRVELGEIEAVVRQDLRFGWRMSRWAGPRHPSGYGGVEVFIEGEAKD